MATHAELAKMTYAEIAASKFEGWQDAEIASELAIRKQTLAAGFLSRREVKQIKNRINALTAEQQRRSS